MKTKLSQEFLLNMSGAKCGVAYDSIEFNTSDSKVRFMQNGKEMAYIEFNWKLHKGDSVTVTGLMGILDFTMSN